MKAWRVHELGEPADVLVLDEPRPVRPPWRAVEARIDAFVSETPSFAAAPDPPTRVARRQTMGKAVCLVDPGS